MKEFMTESNLDNHYYKILEKVMDNKNKERKRKENNLSETPAEEEEISYEQLDQLMKEVNEEISELQFNADK